MKFAMFVFNGEAMCFIHVLLNALEMHEKGHEVTVILEGASAKLVPLVDQPGQLLAKPWQKALDAGLIGGVCKACATTLGTRDAAVERGLPLLAEISGHPSILSYRSQGYEIITF